MNLSAIQQLLIVIFLAVGALASESPTPSVAMNLEQQGKFADAAEVWRQITKEDPTDAGAFASLGVDLSRQAKYSEAASAYKKALALNPTLPGIQLNLGLTDFKLGRFAAAIAPLKSALAQDPSNSQAGAL